MVFFRKMSEAENDSSLSVTNNIPNKYDFTIEIGKFNKLISERKQDTQRSNSYAILGKWLEELLAKVREVEGAEIVLKATKARLNSEVAKKGASYFNGNAACTFKGCKATYSFRVGQAPEKSQRTVSFSTIRNKEHTHSQTSNKEVRVVGEERAQQAVAVLVEASGSSTAYHDHSIKKKETNCHLST